MWWQKRESREISALDDKIEKLRRDFQNLELEWTNFFDKARRMLQRISKRAELVEKAEEAERTEAVSPAPAPMPLQSRGGLLTDRQREIQQQILRRRAGG